MKTVRVHKSTGLGPWLNHVATLWLKPKLIAMKNPDDELCLCFHVTRRKVENWIRIEKPKRVSQLSECYGAGTGCGWCRPFLERLFEQAETVGEGADELPTVEQYAQLRAEYRQKKNEESSATGSGK